MNGDWPNLFSEKLGSLRAPFVIVFKRMAEASAHSSGVRDVVCEDQSCEKNSAPSALSSLESVVDVDVSTGKNVSYADAGRPEREEPVAYFVDEENEVPQRPCTAFVNPRTRLSATDVFEALKLSDVDPKQISCIQRQSNGEIQLTFRNAKQRELFLKKNVIQIRGQPFALQDVDRPLTYLQIFDSPYELPDSTIINRLAKYCDVLHHRRGYFREPGFEHIQDGVRHYRVRIKNPNEMPVELNNEMPVNGLPEMNAENVEDRHVVNGDSYASRAARTVSYDYPPRQERARFSENVMPQWPRTAFLMPSKNTTAKSVFEALENAEIDATEIACLQRTMNGEVTVTFKSIPFIAKSSITVGVSIRWLPIFIMASVITGSGFPNRSPASSGLVTFKCL